MENVIEVIYSEREQKYYILNNNYLKFMQIIKLIRPRVQKNDENKIALSISEMQGIEKILNRFRIHIKIITKKETHYEEKQTKNCCNCQYYRADECAGFTKNCQDFFPVPYISNEEMKYWEKEGDASKFRRKSGYKVMTRNSYSYY